MVGNTCLAVMGVQTGRCGKFCIIQSAVVSAKIAHIGNIFNPAFKIDIVHMIYGCDFLLVGIFHIFEKLGQGSETENFNKGIKRNVPVFVIVLEVFDEWSAPVASDFVLNILKKCSMVLGVGKMTAVLIAEDTICN